MERICSNGGTLDQHNVSSRFGCVWRCHKALEHFKTKDERKKRTIIFLEEPQGIDHTEETCSWYMKSLEEIHALPA